jgi:D-alanyl-D-alanine endopeptidase (penicillin-binding protein 7)
MQKLLLILLMYWAGTSQARAPHTVLVQNLSTGASVVSENADAVRPMASITKLMTAIVSIEYYNLQDVIITGKKSSMTVEQLLTNLLVRSDNHASELLARNYPWGRHGFLDAMNQKTKVLGLPNTQFNDPSGLLATNTTTANDLAKLVAAAGTYDFIRKVSTMHEVYKVDTKNKKSRTVAMSNTNRTILFEFNNILVSKTGFTSKAGRCVAMLVDKQGQQYAIIILGEPSKQARDLVARKLLLADNINF